MLRSYQGRIMGYQAANEQIRTISAALIAFYRKRWLEWGISGDLGFRLNDHLHVIEFRASDCDTDELFEAFVKANEALERKAYGSGQHHFGIGYLARRPDRDDGMIRALVMVEPGQVEGFRIAADELTGSSSALAVTKCEIDLGDPDAHWRWLAEGIISSAAMFEDSEPRFALIDAAASTRAWSSNFPASQAGPPFSNMRAAPFPGVSYRFASPRAAERPTKANFWLMHLSDCPAE